MADRLTNKFKMYATRLADTSLTTLLTATDSSIHIIGSIIIANTDNTNSAKITVKVNDSDQATDFNFLTEEEFTPGLSREMLHRPIILENLDSLKMQADTGNIFDILISYLDKSRN
jgi:uncharacterized protein YukJ